MLRACVLACIVAGCRFHPGTAAADAVLDDPVDAMADAAPTKATLFVADATANKVFRYALSIDPAPPPAPAEIAVGSAVTVIILPATRELLVGELTTSTIARFTTPFATPVASGTITNNGLSNNMAKMVLVDDELWIVNAGAIDVDRLAFDLAGNASMVDSVPATNGRGMVFDRTTRDLYVTECCANHTILHFKIAADRTPTAQPSFDASTAGMSNPHGMVITPWGELLVADAGFSQIFRFRRDSQGNLTANGKIVSANLATPVDLAWAPWGELFVTNQTTHTIARFTFDAAYAANEHGVFTVPGAQQLLWTALAE